MPRCNGGAIDENTRISQLTNTFLDIYFSVHLPAGPCCVGHSFGAIQCSALDFCVGLELYTGLSGPTVFGCNCYQKFASDVCRFRVEQTCVEAERQGVKSGHLSLIGTMGCD